MFLAGIDLGTTGCKSMVFDSSGNIAGSHYIEYDLAFTSDGVEQDAGLWWDHAKTALAKAISKAGINGRDLKAIGVASQGIASVPVDGEGRPLANALSWYDGRAQKEADEIAAHYGADYLLEKTGRYPGSLFFPQTLHIKRNNIALYEKARYFLMAQDYLVYRLTGRALTDYTMASGTLCFDTGEHRWIGGMFDRYAIDREKFPALSPFGAAAGKLLPRAAEELGLAEETVVAVGMQDQKAAALGAGITLEAPGSVVCLSLGTASAVLRLSDKKIVDKKGRVFCHAFDEKSWVTENYLGSSGASYKWLRNTLFPGLSYAELDALAHNSEAGAGGLIFIPDLSEKQGCFSGLSLNTKAEDMARGVLEGVAYGVRRCVDLHREASGLSVSEIRAYGGGAGSGLWCQILADVLGIPVSLPKTPECANLGAAICAGKSLGLFNDRDSLAAFIGPVSRRFEPNPGNSSIYKKCIEKFANNDHVPLYEGK